MKRSIIRLLLAVAVTSTVLTACDNREDILSENNVANQEGNLPDGYFRATFFPQPADGNSASRSAVNGNSQQIQSLVCLIYRKQADNSYDYVTEKQVISYDGNVGNVTPQTYEWPLRQELTFDLPSGDYKAVFVANVDKKLFASQGTNELLTNYTNKFGSARINMPEVGPMGFNDYNMFYLSTVDFSPSNPSPYVILQRVVTNNVYTRATIDDNQAVNMLADNLVKQIRENQLTTELVHDLLRAKILQALQPIEALTGILTPVVDRLVNILLGDVLEYLNKTLLEQVISRLEASLKADGGPDNSLLGLNYILNPWTTVDNVNVKFVSLPKSIDFNRECQSYYGETVWTGIPLTKPEGMENGGVGDYTDLRQVSIITLCGNHKLTAIDVETQSFLLASTLQKLDEKALNGLLVNIHQPLGYPMQSNLQYKTPFELLNLTLSDFTPEQSQERLALSAQLKDIVNLEEVVKQLLGENIISGLIGGLTNNLLDPLLIALDQVVIGDLLDIKLPGLNLNNIAVNGGWDATKVSDGTIAPSLDKK
ncbi:MAG: hypothetical protein K2M93_00460 [Muribaculaceae bacterium]|nr:hypothetical protein [Muribaculaceae bacterium]